MAFFVAFYSYKGGVGRSLALANVGYSLAARGKRVVLLDMDLEAPGLQDFPELALKGAAAKRGFLEYATHYSETGQFPPVGKYVHPCRESPGHGRLWLMPAGNLAGSYQERLGSLSWRCLHPTLGTEPFAEGLRWALIEELAPHYVLIDARTGLSDVGGLSTHLLADMVVLMFNLTRSCLEGSVRAYRSFTAPGAASVPEREADSLPAGSRIRFLQLVASPVPPEAGGAGSLVESRLAQAAELMPLGTAFGRPILCLDYHPGMALAEELAVRRPQQFPAAARYEALRESIQRVSPEEVLPVLEQARELRGTGRLETGLELLRAFVDAHPRDPEGALELGNFLLEAGRAAEASDAFRRACNAAPGDAYIHRRLGESLVAAGRIDEAIASLDQAASLGDRSRELNTALASAYARSDNRGREKEARHKAILAILGESPAPAQPEKSLVGLRREFVAFLRHHPPFPGFDAETFCSKVTGTRSLSEDQKAAALQQVLAGALRPIEITDLLRLLDEEEERPPGELQAQEIGASARVRVGGKTVKSTVSGRLHPLAIDANVGRAAFPLRLSEDIAPSLKLGISRENLAELRLWLGHSARRPLYAVDPGDLAQAGWGILFAADDGRACEIRAALQPLLEHRRGQAGELYRELSYRPGETKTSFLTRHGAGPGPADPHVMPYYLLIVGDPEAIPFSVQCQLDIEYGVGRLCFDTLADYAMYAENVVAAETARRRRAGRAVFFGPMHPEDPSTSLTATHLIAPLASRMAEYFPGWETEAVLGRDATKAALGRLLGTDTPDLLFTAGHGLVFDPEDPRQRSAQGALVCADWPGSHHGPVEPGSYFSADDLDGRERLAGLITFHFASFSAGSPACEDDFGAAAQWRIARRPFVARLAQRLLGSGALAVIGKIDQGWFPDIEWAGTGRQMGVFDQVLGRLMEGGTVGAATEAFNRRYAELSSDLSIELSARHHRKLVDENALLALWAAARDARSYVTLGDPAVRFNGVCNGLSLGNESAGAERA